MVKVTGANASDNQIVIESLTDMFSWYITIHLVCADATYRRELEDWLYLAHQSQLQMASTLGRQRHEVVPLGWIVERYPKTAGTMLYIAVNYLMRNRVK